MSNNIPEIDALLSGINRSGHGLGEQRNPLTEAADKEDKDTFIPDTAISRAESLEEFWQEVLDLLQNDYRPKDRRAYCVIDRDIADTLDECPINGQCRTTIVNIILRVAVKTFLPRLAEYRRESSSFFQPPKDPQP